MSDHHDDPALPTQPEPRQPAPTPRYQIRIDGRLAARWSAWFDGLTIASSDDGITVISGPVVDQTALHGLIQKVRDIGLPLISVTQLSSQPSDEHPAHDTQQEN